MFAYCGNNPVNLMDPTGEITVTIGTLLLIAFGVGSLIGAISSVVGQYISNDYSFEEFSWWQFALDTVLGGASGMLSMSPLGPIKMVLLNAGIGFVGGLGGHLINGSDFSDRETWVDILLSKGLGAVVGCIGGEGALNPTSLNMSAPTAGFVRAAGLYDDVLTKATTGGYRTLGIAANAIRLSGYNLANQWNKMIVYQAGNALKKSLFYSGTALIIGTAGKGLLYKWLIGD